MKLSSEEKKLIIGLGYAGIIMTGLVFIVQSIF